MSQQTEWTEFDDDRQFKRIREHVYALRPNVVADHIPMFCPACDFVMTSRGDMFTYKKFTCCEWCANNWAYPLAAAWAQGWRPTADDINDALNRRNRAPLGFNDK